MSLLICIQKENLRHFSKRTFKHYVISVVHKIPSQAKSEFPLSPVNKIQLGVYYQCCILIG